MGDYLYERFTPDRFQDFVASLMATEHPGYQVFPVGQKDGGRDGRAPSPEGGSIIFQVKFKRTLKAREDYYRWLTDAIKAELPKIERLARAGAKRYVLVTNVPGTAAPVSGTMDKIQAYMDAHIPIPAQCLWRADIDVRLNGNYDLKWFFSEILATPDVIRQLLTERLGEHRERRVAAITGYLRSQYDTDSHVKFKQAELQASDLLNLFVDVPGQLDIDQTAPTKRGPTPDLRRVLADVSHNTLGSDQELNTRHFMQRRGREGEMLTTTMPLPAGSLLLHGKSGQLFPKTVVEGAPGQGKSTLAQYLCQVYRMQILNRDSDLKRIPGHHRLAPTRVPFKVDLRDLSQWLEGVDHRKKPGREAHDKAPTLETFLAYEVEHLSGGQTFDASDLHVLAHATPLLLVLDGFDEVATPSQRQQIVDEIDRALNRLTPDALSIQTIVTSRPSALPDSPRFDEANWKYITLASISRPLALEYAGRWGKARGLDPQERAEIELILAQKLESPHLRDLARNPMQLTILLTLIHLRGQSLPDQRTAMYENYIDVFFNREAEKTAVVRDNRQLLIDLHAFLAWKMHSEAEASRGDGRITADELKRSIAEYLQTREYTEQAVESLFEGVVQRIVALVSRSEGTFEFEVQPLREYFAAHHLYHTAPHSPPGNPVHGTKPEILSALFANPYWQNVLRFFAGFYSVGELPGLASDLMEALSDPGMRNPIYQRRLATNLLSDWVLHQSPSWTRKLVEAAVDGLTLRVANQHDPFRTSEISVDLHRECGGEQVARRALHAIPQALTSVLTAELAVVARAGLSGHELSETWWNWIDQEVAAPDVLLRIGQLLGVTKDLTEEEICRLGPRWPTAQALTMDLAFCGAANVMVSDDDQERVLRWILNGESPRLLHHSPWVDVAWCFHSFPNTVLLRGDAVDFVHDVAGSFDGESIVRPFVRDLASVFSGYRRKHASEFAGSLAPWQRLIDRLDDAVGPVFLSSLLACASAGIVAPTERATGASDLFAADVDLTLRSRYARLHSGNAAWWKRHYSRAGSEHDREFWALCMLAWASTDVQSSNHVELDSVLNSLSERRFLTMLEWLARIRSQVRSSSNSRRSEAPLLSDSTLRRCVVHAVLPGGLGRKELGAAERLGALEFPNYARELLLEWTLEALPERPGPAAWVDFITEVDRLTDGMHLVSISRWDRVQSLPHAGGALTEELSRHILTNALRMPLVAIRAADWRLSRRSKRLVPLASIARSDGWNVG